MQNKNKLEKNEKTYTTQELARNSDSDAAAFHVSSSKASVIECRHSILSNRNVVTNYDMSSVLYIRIFNSSMFIYTQHRNRLCMQLIFIWLKRPFVYGEIVLDSFINE